MTSDPLFLLVAVAVLATFLVLMTGVLGFAKGGKFNRKYGNKLMRLRILLQFIAVLAILLFVWIRRGG